MKCISMNYEKCCQMLRSMIVRFGRDDSYIGNINYNGDVNPYSFYSKECISYVCMI